MSEASGLMGLDRKAMEEERLRRLALKRGTTHEIEHERMTKVPRKEDQVTTRQASQRASGPTTSSVVASKPLVASAGLRVEERGGIQYRRGVFKKTWVFGQERVNDIKIEEVLQKQDLNIAVLSSFQWDMEWVFSKLDLTKTKLVLVMEAKDESTKAQYRRESVNWAKNLRLCFPPMPGQVFCMHSKLMLLFHANHLRIVIPTANLLSFDWGETGIMENSVFLIDLPRIPDSKAKATSADHTPFAKDLLYFLEAMGLDEDIRTGIHNFDFSETSHLAFVHTIGGSHVGAASKRTGYPQLGRGVKQLGLQCDISEPMQAGFATSSCGALTETQLEALYNALRGKEPLLPTGPAKGKPTAVQPMHLPPHLRSLKDRFHILFPSNETVARSRGGRQNGGTICMSSKYWDNPNFPKECMHEYISTRLGVLSHNKIILARTPNKAFYYLGSANISQSAWGTMVWDRTAKASKLNARNWECGVLVPAVLPKSENTPVNGPVHLEQDKVIVTIDDSSTDSEGESSKTTQQSKESSSSIGAKHEGTSAVDHSRPSTVKTAAGPVSPPAVKRKPETAKQNTQVLPMSVFTGVIDVPFEWPAKTYMPGQRPWFFRGDEGGHLEE